MGAWSLIGGGVSPADATSEWFAKRFKRARALVSAANFDTVIGSDFGETISTEFVDEVGTVLASVPDDVDGGAVNLIVGDDAIALCQARLQMTASGSHVKSLASKSWYIAALAKYGGPFDANVGDTAVDAISLWADDNNRVTLGVLGNVSGGSTEKWVGRIENDSTNTTTLGPDLDALALWHLFEAWSDGTTVKFAIDDAVFAGTIAASLLPDMAARLSAIAQRSAAGEDRAIMTWDKFCVVVKSPDVGGP